MVSLSKPTLEIKFQAPQRSSSRLVNEDCGLDDEVLPDLAGGLAWVMMILSGRSQSLTDGSMTSSMV
jgi:hypothetical protein